ncbi:MAG: GyrI-like domain-containing protein [Pseudomonadota bacterium]
MSSGLVYLRPMKVTHVRAPGLGADAAKSAWNDLVAHLRHSHTINRVDRSYGMSFGSGLLDSREADEPFYDAAIEWLPEMEISPDSPLRLRTLPGGTYLRQRLQGAAEEISSVFRRLCATAEHETGLPLDPKRPLIEIYLGRQPGELHGARIDLCVPVDPAKAGGKPDVFAPPAAA